MIRNPHNRWLRAAVAVAFFLAVAVGLLFYTTRFRTGGVGPASQNLQALTDSAWWWAMLATLLSAAVWLAVVWVLVQVWEYRMSRTSLYTVEHLIDSEQQSTGSDDLSSGQ